MRLIDCFSPLFGYVGGAMSGLGPYPPMADFRAAVEELLRRGEDAYGKGGFSAADFEEARFAAAAWVDEQVLTGDWPEKDKWRTMQLQKVYYHTTNAGREFFERMAGLTDDRKAVREVYLACLVMGFRGKYYGVRDIPELEAVGAEQVARVMREVMNPFAAEDRKFFPAAYLDPKDFPKRKVNWGFISIMLLTGLMGSAVVTGLWFGFAYILNDKMSW